MNKKDLDYQPSLSPFLRANWYLVTSKWYKSGALCAPPFLLSFNFPEYHTEAFFDKNYPYSIFCPI